MWGSSGFQPGFALHFSLVDQTSCFPRAKEERREEGGSGPLRGYAEIREIDQTWERCVAEWQIIYCFAQLSSGGRSWLGCSSVVVPNSSPRPVYSEIWELQVLTPCHKVPLAPSERTGWWSVFSTIETLESHCSSAPRRVEPSGVHPGGRGCHDVKIAQG